MLISCWLFFLYLLFNESLPTFPLTFHFPPLSPQLPLSRSPPLSLPLSLHLPAGALLAQGYALSPHISLWWIFYLAFQVSFSYWKRACVPPWFHLHSSLWNISVSDEVVTCLRISGGLLIRECRSGLWIFINSSSWKRHEAKLWSAGIEPQVTSLNLNAVRIYCGLCGPTERPLQENSLFHPLFLSIFPPFCFFRFSLTWVTVIEPVRLLKSLNSRLCDI